MTSLLASSNSGTKYSVTSALCRRKTEMSGNENPHLPKPPASKWSSPDFKLKQANDLNDPRLATSLIPKYPGSVYPLRKVTAVLNSEQYWCTVVLLFRIHSSLRPEKTHRFLNFPDQPSFLQHPKVLWSMHLSTDSSQKDNFSTFFKLVNWNVSVKNVLIKGVST